MVMGTVQKERVVVPKKILGQLKELLTGLGMVRISPENRGPTLFQFQETPYKKQQMLNDFFSQKTDNHLTN